MNDGTIVSFKPTVANAADIVKSNGGYNYYGFTSPNGSWRILRESVDGLEYRLSIGRTDYVTNFTNRASLSYTRSNELPVL